MTQSFPRPLILLLAGLLALTTLQACKNRDQGDNKKKDQAMEKPAIPADLAAKYKEDAHRLTAREYNTTSRNEQLQTQLPVERVNFFYDLLVKVYLKAKSDPEIPSIAGIHTFPSPSLNAVTVMLEKDADFAENWMNGQRMTSNLYLNQVMSENGLKVSDCFETGAGTMCKVSTSRMVNTKDLAFILQGIDGIKTADPEGAIGDGNNIEWGSEGKNHMALKFSKGAGDCPSGCIYRKYWIFYVSEGTINYIGTRGELPAEGEENGED